MHINIKTLFYTILSFYIAWILFMSFNFDVPIDDIVPFDSDIINKITYIDGLVVQLIITILLIVTAISTMIEKHRDGEEN